jgi:hypothetical protein
MIGAWSRDATVDIADEVRRRFIEYDEVPASLLRFLDAANGHIAAPPRSATKSRRFS